MKNIALLTVALSLIIMASASAQVDEQNQTAPVVEEQKTEVAVEAKNADSEKEPQETNAMNKMMTWYGIQMNTIKDQSNSKISELLMQGTNMGIIEGRRLLNNNPSIDQEVKEILNDFVVMQEDSVETLKKYL